ncbi:hypothetical protein FY557_14035 [Chryseobacterium sp. SN22]|uniref:hypothetical protein n=1 Tax=Chryseobacterium sp. SN22 TaxID=2606431 RepID=UPI0011EC4754|nr:hypothetical protein [Chryseobacterium sp. SN22]KAA0127284.1 hypothetical protein FY557_14035 [Chryseobacterium sp. SN22]
MKITELIREQYFREYLIINFSEKGIVNTNMLNFINRCIDEARQYKCDLLLGGVIGFNRTLMITENLFWIDEFLGFNFIIVFKSSYNTIIEQSVKHDDLGLEKTLSLMLENIFVMYPFVEIDYDSDNFLYIQQNNLFDELNRIKKFYLE